MTTEHGMARPASMRKYIETLRDRMEWLEDCVAEDIDDRGKPNGYHQAEIAALRWALPVLEAEWDASVRLRDEVSGSMPRDKKRSAA